MEDPFSFGLGVPVLVALRFMEVAMEAPRYTGGEFVATCISNSGLWQLRSKDKESAVKV